MATLAAPGVSATARSRSDVTDHDLVQAVRAGDDHAFERLYHRYHRRIAAYIFGMVRPDARPTSDLFEPAVTHDRNLPESQPLPDAAESQEESHVP